MGLLDFVATKILGHTPTAREVDVFITWVGQTDPDELHFFADDELDALDKTCSMLVRRKLVIDEIRLKWRPLRDSRTEGQSSRSADRAT